MCQREGILAQVKDITSVAKGGLVTYVTPDGQPATLQVRIWR